MTAPDIFEWLRQVKWTSIHSWLPLHNVIVFGAGSVAEISRRWIKRRNARLAQNWPPMDGTVQSISVVKGTKFYGSARHPNATFTYSYSVKDGGELDYFTGVFSRQFQDEDRAWEWLRSIKDKRIRVHVQPEKPQVSVVLAADLDAHFPLPVRTPEDLVFASPEIHS